MLLFQIYYHCQSNSVRFSHHNPSLENTMLEVERNRLILKLLEQRSVIAIDELVETLGVSAATVRRDINGLAEAGKLRLIRGGIEALQPRYEPHLVGVPFELSVGMGAAQKSAIGQAA